MTDTDTEVALEDLEHYRKAVLAAQVINAASPFGYTAVVKYYPAYRVNYAEGGYYVHIARTYVLADAPGLFTYTAQWHENKPDGTGFLRNRGEGFDEAFAESLNDLIGYGEIHE